VRKKIPVALALAALTVAALGFASAFVTGAGAGPSRHHPVKTVRLTAVYYVEGTYSNSFDAGDESQPWAVNGCQAGKENASFAVKIRFSRIKIRLAAPFAAWWYGTDLTSGHWSEVGTQWNTYMEGWPCNHPGATKPLQCSGSVSSPPPSNLSVFVHARAVHFVPGFPGALDPSEANTNACGDFSADGYRLSAIPYLGLRDVLSEWATSDATVSLGKLASLRRHSTLKLPVSPRPSPTWNPSTCDGRDGKYRGQTCSGSLSITKSGLTLHVG
jgi:hypothetical protein